MDPCGDLIRFVFCPLYTEAIFVLRYIFCQVKRHRSAGEGMEKFQVKGAKAAGSHPFPWREGQLWRRGNDTLYHRRWDSPWSKLHPYLMMTAGVKVDFQLCLIRRRVFKKAFLLYRNVRCCLLE